MPEVFSCERPILRINDFQSQSDRDEQMKFMFLSMGPMSGIRNPKAHDVAEQNDPHRTMQSLA